MRAAHWTRTQPNFIAAWQRAADVFDVPLTMVSIVEADTQEVCGASGELRDPPDPFQSAATVPQTKGLRAFVRARRFDGGMASCWKPGVFSPRHLNNTEVRLLHAMAKELMQALRAAVSQWGLPANAAGITASSDSATVGQMIPEAR
ncbi:hypothetical protein [Variovorax sp. Sphag1AA]|uniref:hypothetical protein n=1 Tax=Variovorax sp. Sphag1AA TaxID=2587027 RepID=UPI00161A039E|nr:hypothetical protein [Variovorax sp. Sphag1AA]MBB3178811.1 hypothetical protein [Variovorax sp. Sphag1AA]